jgi:hypothetical protein
MAATLLAQTAIFVPHASAVTCGGLTDDYIYYRSNGSSFGTRSTIRFTSRSLSTCPDPTGGIKYTGSGVALQVTPGNTSKIIEFGWYLPSGAYSCSPTCWNWFWLWQDGAAGNNGTGSLAGFSCVSGGNYAQFAIVSTGGGSFNLRFRCLGGTYTTLKTITNRSFSSGVSEVETLRYVDSGASDDQYDLEYRTSTTSNFTPVTRSPTCVSDSIVGWDGLATFSSSQGYGYETHSVTNDGQGC